MPPSDLPKISSVLRLERFRAGLTVRQLAEKSALKSSTLHRLESGQTEKVKPVQLQRIAQALGIDVEAFYAAATDMPELRVYLRSKYGISEDGARQVEGYVQAVRDRDQQSIKRREGDRESPGDTQP